MTRSDYFLIAKAIKGLRPKLKREILRELIPNLKKDNPSFQTFRFLLSCDAAELYEEEPF